MRKGAEYKPTNEYFASFVCFSIHLIFSSSVYSGYSGYKQISLSHHLTKDSDLCKSSKPLVLPVRDLSSSLWINEVDEEYFLSLGLWVVEDEEDDLCLTLPLRQWHYIGLQAEVLLLLCEDPDRFQSEGKRCRASIWIKPHSSTSWSGFVNTVNYKIQYTAMEQQNKHTPP